jgi:tetrapyrrole methylase family protein/MazG family protein
MSSGQLFERLIEVIRRLRDPKTGCPWDLQQDHKSLKSYLIEEAYELLAAIDAHAEGAPPSELAEELGDVLLQVVLHSQVAADNKHFSIDDVVRTLTEKLIRRHPHVFGGKKVSSAEEVAKNWEHEKQQHSGKHLLDGLPRAMPALLVCHRIGEKVGRVGFDWPDSAEVREKVTEELNEFLEADAKPEQDAAHTKEELGDLLFTLAQLARKMGLNAEEVLVEANDKFCRRFARMEDIAGGSLEGKTEAELEALWQQVKKEEAEK